MSDDLVKRLRLDWTSILGACVGTMIDAADRIAELEAALRDARARYVELNDKDAAEAMALIINKALGDAK